MDAKGGQSSSEPLSELMREKHYKQTYVILAPNAGGQARQHPTLADANEVLFQCGNWSYRGHVQFNGLKLVLKELPVLIASLQKQQGNLRYYCNSNSVPADSYFHEPLNVMNDAANFFGKEITSEETEEELQNLSKTCPWINDDSSTTYFELALDGAPQCLEQVCLIASKTYVRGLIIISVYFEGSIYYMVQSGEGDQALLDVRFPDITRRGQGMHLASYAFPHLPYSKLTLWLLLDSASGSGKDGALDYVSAKELPKIRTVSVASKNYQQTYCIMKSAWEGAVPQLSVHHDVLFRFGSWCYAGRVQLIPSLSLGDLPFVIPALRMQQSRLEYLCDTANVPTTSPFAAAMDFIQRHEPMVEQLIEQSSDTLAALIERLNRMGVGEAVSKWLEGDPRNSFFEFKMHPDDALLAAFNPIELVASKSYHASGIITTLILYQYTIYICLSDGSKENPLLDSTFPDIAGKGRGYQIAAYPEGLPEWPSLRKVSVWQTVSALEEEFNQRAATLAQGKGPSSMAGLGGEISALVADAIDSAAAKGVADGSGAGALAEKEAYSSSSAAADSKEGPSTSYRSASAAAATVDPEDEVPAVAEDKRSEPAGGDVGGSGNAAKAVTTAKEASGDHDFGEGGAAKDSFSASPGSGAGSALGPSSGSFSSSGGLGSSAPGRSAFGTPSASDGQFASTRMARPHHLPKMESLSRKLEEIKSSAGDGESAPWDATGRPVLGSQLAKK